MEWVKQAACAGQGDVFFPETGGALTAAKKLCASCPVRQQCEDYGKSMLHAETPLYRGLWGGKTVPELSIEEQRSRPAFVQGSCAVPGCSNDLVPSGSNHPRKYCSVKCKKRAEHLREKERAKELA
jgi:hypothetical protein